MSANLQRPLSMGIAVNTKRTPSARTLSAQDREGTEEFLRPGGTARAMSIYRSRVTPGPPPVAPWYRGIFLGEVTPGPTDSTCKT